MKKMNKLIAVLLALTMVLSLAACGGDTTPDTTAAGGETAGTTAPISGNSTVEPLGSGNPKWTEEETADGWVKVTNDGGDTLGYSKNSGVSLIQVDGFAFKDLDRDGELDVYEDWRLDSVTRANDLANKMTADEIMPYLTHGGWGTFTTDKITEDNAAYEYIVAGGRGGVTRNAGSTTEANVDHAKWVNLVQELCESQPNGIPALISIDPNGQSNMIDCLALAATMDPDMAFEVGKAYAEQYRAMGISALLGPQIDLMTSPVMDRGNGTYGEDPALTRDIAEAFVSGMQSTWAEDGTDLGWGNESVMCIMKHYAGAGASEGGRNDHMATGKYSVFPSNNFEAHLIAFHDGAFNLKRSSTGAAGGIMTNYSISYSDDGSLGDLVAGGYSEFKYGLLKASGWDGFIISDWGIFGDGGSGSWGTEELTSAERVATTIKLGMDEMGGFGDLEVMAEAWDLLEDELGEEEALKLIRTGAAKNIETTMNLELFENPYCSIDHVKETCYTTEALAFGLETQLAGIVMLKNDGTIKEGTGEKPTVYIPYVYTPSSSNSSGTTDASWNPMLNLDIAANYFNVVTDTVGEPTGEANEAGQPTYTVDDIVRATASEVASCDLVLVGMNSPHTDSTSVTDDAGNTTWLPASIQYGEYTATTAKEESVAGDTIITQFNDGYTVQTVETTENRSYRGNTAAQATNYNDLETLQYAASVAGDAKVVVLMNVDSSLVWTEVEPMADVILCAYGAFSGGGATPASLDEAYMKVVVGEYEPNGLLVVQMPASMEAVEAQADDVPRDMECYVDANGNTYDFAFGMNWSGVINDERVQTYSASPLTECETFDFQYAK